MKIPINNNEWAVEALKAYELAFHDLVDGKSVASDKYNLFRAAPIIAAENRGISSANRKVSILADTVADIEHDLAIDPVAKNNYLFHFILAYIRSHVYGGYLKEMESDKILNYINDHYDLFEHVVST
jgi:hypothetical protein